MDYEKQTLLRFATAKALSERGKATEDKKTQF